MNYLVFTIGVLILCFVLLDIAVATLARRGSRFLTKWFRSFIWSIFYRLSKRRGNSKILNYAGMVTVTSLLLAWLSIFWLGNSLIYISDSNSVLVNQTKIAATALEKVYFVGYVLSTMGLGDFEPNGNGWKIYTSIISFSGIIIITIWIAYLMPVLSAEMEKRKVATYINSLGTSPSDILLNAWNGEDFSRLSQHFIGIANFIMNQSQNHVAYPVLHNFHSHLKKESLYINLASLDEALTILLLYIPNDVKPSKQEIYPVRYAITDYLTTLEGVCIMPSERAPGSLRLDQLQKNKIPLKQDSAETMEKLGALTLRRKILLVMIEYNGWIWGSIYNENESSEYELEHKRQLLL